MSRPLTNDEFAAAMARFDPFEPRPRLVVAVSGGSDSLALTLLAHDWATARGGSVIGVTVDHRLRKDSTAEAARVGDWLKARGIDHHVLAWIGDKPSTGIQDAARAARRNLLLGFCRAHALFHLLLGHQRDDQAETFLLRAEAGSGRDGLAGMADVVETAEARILRPLLHVPRDRLAATLSARGQAWIDDPSNVDPRFARARLRELPATRTGFAETARGFGVERRARDDDVAALLGRAVAIFPEGYASLDPAPMMTAPEEIGRRALARIVLTIGGGAYAPRGARRDGLYRAICDGALRAGCTLGGCRIAPRKGGLVVARETASLGPGQPVSAPGRYPWDDRFWLRIAGRQVPPGCVIRALGADGWRDLAARDKSLRKLAVSPLARPSLPALWDLEGVRDVPHLSYRRYGADPDSVRVVTAVFRPRHVLAGAGFAAL